MCLIITNTFFTEDEAPTHSPPNTQPSQHFHFF